MHSTDVFETVVDLPDDALQREFDRLVGLDSYKTRLVRESLLLIEPALLTAGEREWLDAYHARVLAEVAPQVDATTAAWLRRVCAAL